MKYKKYRKFLSCLTLTLFVCGLTVNASVYANANMASHEDIKSEQNIAENTEIEMQTEPEQFTDVSVECTGPEIIGTPVIESEELFSEDQEDQKNQEDSEEMIEISMNSQDEEFAMQAYRENLKKENSGYINVGNVISYEIIGDENVTYDKRDATLSQAEFIEKIGNSAVKQWEQYHILPSVTISQAIIESGWGKSTLAYKYHNYFGIKWYAGRGSDYAELRTKEQLKNGEVVTITAKFCAYSSLDECLEARYKLLTTSQRYSNIVGVTDYRTVCRLLQQDGYATSHTYAQLLIKTIEEYGLDKYDEMAIGK